MCVLCGVCGMWCVVCGVCGMCVCVRDMWCVCGVCVWCVSDCVQLFVSYATEIYIFPVFLVVLCQLYIYSYTNFLFCQL